MDCTTIGLLPPTITPPTLTATDFRRGAAAIYCFPPLLFTRAKTLILLRRRRKVAVRLWLANFVEPASERQPGKPQYCQGDASGLRDGVDAGEQTIFFT